jgi:hypothetical protein
MCDVNGSFKLCTCADKIDKSKPYWVLKTDRQIEDLRYVVGTFSESDPIFTPLIRRNILRRLNSVKSIFDFEYTPNDGDLLKLVGDRDQFYCEFNKGKWKWVEVWEYLGLKHGGFKSKQKGYIEGEKSELMELVEEYESITNQVLYSEPNFGFPVLNEDLLIELQDVKISSQKELKNFIKKKIDQIKGN